MHISSKTWRQRPPHDQLPLQSRRQLIAFCQSWGQMSAMSHIPFVQFAVMLAIAAMLAIVVTVFPVLTPFFFGFVAILLIFIVPVAVTLCHSCNRTERHSNRDRQVRPFGGRHILS